MNLIYTFTKKLNHTSLDRTLDLYKESFKINSKFHNIVLYTDTESQHLLNDVFTNIVIIDTNDVLFFDDLKFKVLSLLNDDDVLCDGDLFLNRRLWFNHNYDILCDTFVETKFTKHYDFYGYYRSVSNILIQNDIKKIIPFYNNELSKVINIGLLWFKNKETRNKFLELYFLQKHWILENGLEHRYKFTSDFKNTVTFSQYLLGLFAIEYNLKTEQFKNYCDYVHYSGSEKFHPDFMKRFQKELI